jgi:hypothetical protein
MQATRKHALHTSKTSLHLLRVLPPPLTLLLKCRRWPLG